MKTRVTKWAAFATVASALLMAPGCRAIDREQLRELTYPHDFDYVERSQIQSTMGELAWRVSELDRLLAVTAEPPRQQLSELLREMELTLAKLARRGWPSNHPGFAANAETMRYELQRARRNVERDPPSYFWAGTVSEVCLRCHGYDRRGAR